MDLSSLKPASGSVHKEGKRLGRGQGSGRGGTSTKGHKGQKAISGYSHKIGFEGGQMPIQRRLPKFGFKNINRVEYKGLNLQTLEDLSEKTGKDFDKAYVSAMVDDHKEDVKKFEEASKDGKDADIKTWAAEKLPTLNHHLETVQALKETLK